MNKVYEDVYIPEWEEKDPQAMCRGQQFVFPKYGTGHVWLCYACHRMFKLEHEHQRGNSDCLLSMVDNH